MKVSRATIISNFVLAVGAFLSIMIPSVQAEDKLPSDEKIFNMHCKKCHGLQGSGTDKGPPLVHKVYHPNHHADFSFQMAVKRGVRQHHWKFGNMPKIKEVSDQDTELIIKYIRGLQKEAGIF